MTRWQDRTSFLVIITANILFLVGLTLYSHYPSYTRTSLYSASESYPTKKIEKKEKLFPCDDFTPQRYYGQRGNYWVLYNYLQPTRSFPCDQSITYTTHADWTFLDNLVPLLERWQGPLSLALYSPGTDFVEAFKRILYLRECGVSPLVKQLVAFHLFFDQGHMPGVVIDHNPDQISVNCSSLVGTVTFGKGHVTYKKAQNLTYPVNVARNVARDMAPTHYVFPSDIELYPSPQLIPAFLGMIRRNDAPLQRPAPKVFPLAIFEVEANVGLPSDKEELVSMLHNQSAILFHKYVCPKCHRIPKFDEWINAPISATLGVFHIGKRYQPYQSWEPIFIGTKLDPIYDERLSWEGRRDKMPQGYTLCVLDYEFHILDNAFLVHRPGVKRPKSVQWKNDAVAKQNLVIDSTIIPEYNQMFGTRTGCFA